MFDRQLLAHDAAADRSYWATRGVNLSTLQAGVDEILNTSIPARKNHLFNLYADGGATPLLPPAPFYLM